MKYKILFIILILFPAMTHAGDTTPADPTKTKNEISFTGKVVFSDLEGGFWGVVTDTGDKLDGSVPEKLRVNDLRVAGKYVVKTGAVSIHMWGKLVEFVEIKKQ